MYAAVRLGGPRSPGSGLAGWPVGDGVVGRASQISECCPVDKTCNALPSCCPHHATPHDTTRHGRTRPDTTRARVPARAPLAPRDQCYQPRVNIRGDISRCPLLPPQTPCCPACDLLRRDAEVLDTGQGMQRLQRLHHAPMHIGACAVEQRPWVGRVVCLCRRDMTTWPGSRRAPSPARC